MAQTKVKLISDGVIVQGNLHASHGITTAHIGEGSNLYYTDARVDTRVGNLNTGNLPEGSNLYYTDARADARIAAASTSDLSEGTNLYYTDARADARVALIVDSSPSTLNTLNELAAALGDDPNFAATTATSIGTKLPLAGGTMTGELINTSTAGITANSTSHAYLTVNSSAATTASWVNYEQGGTGRWLAGVEGSETKWQLYSSGTKFSVDTSGNGTFAGNVNISSPGDLYINSGTSYNNKGSIFMSNQRTEIVSDLVDGTANGDTSLNFKTRKSGATASAMFIDELRRVGIGTTSPSGLTHFYGNGDSTYIINQKNSTKWSEWHVGGSNHALIWDSTADMRFMTATSLNGGGASQKMIISSAGNVGINVNPSFKLDVEGDVRIGGTNAQNYPIKMGRDNHAIYLGGPNINTINVGWDTDSNYNMHLNYVGYAGGVTRFRNLVINNGKKGHIATFDGSTGKVGIGATIPATKLDVTGTDNGDTVRVANTGTYGGTISFNQGAGNTNIGYVGSLRAFEGNASGDNGIGLYSRDRISFYTNSITPDLTISDGGNVGIGTTDPDHKLEVVGGLALRNGNSRLYFGTNNGTDRRALEGDVNGTVLQIGEGYATNRIYGDVQMAKTDPSIHSTTADGSDNSSLQLSGGGAFGDSRGASISLAGNENGNSGLVQLRAGQGTYSQIRMYTSGVERVRLTSGGNLDPAADAAQNLGSTSKRWANIYTTDLHLSNKGKSNDVDNTWGDWTIQEGEEDLFLINNRSGKKYKFLLQKID